MAENQRRPASSSDLPRRLSGETPASIAAIIRNEKLNIDGAEEIRHHATGEWLMELQRADILADASGMSTEQKVALVNALRTRNREVRGEYSEAWSLPAHKAQSSRRAAGRDMRSNPAKDADLMAEYLLGLETQLRAEKRNEAWVRNYEQAEVLSVAQ